MGLEVELTDEVELEGEVECPHCKKKFKAKLSDEVTLTGEIEPPERDEL